jgi:putative flippase GtrA
VLKRVVRFGLVGGLTTALNFVVFAGLTTLGVHYLLAGTLGWALGVAVSYRGNKQFTFARGAALDGREFLLFVGGYGLQLGLGLLTYALLIDGLGLTAPLAFVINTALAAAFSFSFMSLAVFRARPAGAGA